jgi:transposase
VLAVIGYPNFNRKESPMSTVNRLGIDFSANSLDLCLVAPDGQPLAPTRRFDHNRPGSQAAAQFVRDTCLAHPANQLLIGGEATGLLWWHLFHQWAADPTLAQLHPVFYLLNPAHVHGFRKAGAPQDKTDRHDARLIARYLGVSDLLPHPWTRQLQTWPLRFLTRFRCRLAHTLGMLKTYAYTWLYLKASAYVQVKPFGDPFGKTSLDLLRQDATLDALAALPVEDLTEQIDLLGRRRFSDPLDNATRLRDAAALSYPLDPAVAEAVHFILTQLIDIIRFLDQRLKTVNAFIAQQVADDADVLNLQSIGGLGPVYAAGLAAEIRPTARFLDGTRLDRTGHLRPCTPDDAQAAVAKLAGLWWPRHDSGQFQSEDRRLSKAGNAYLRYYFIEAANHVRGHVAEYGAFYERKYAQATRHHHQRALVLTARKLARLVFVLLHRHETYQPRRSARD